MLKACKSAWRWLVGQPGYLLLAATDERIDREPPGRFARAWAGLMLFSLAYGALAVSLWSASWTLFRDYGTMYVPALLTVSGLVLWPLRQPVVSLARLVGGRESAARGLAAAVLLLALTICLLRMNPDPDYGKSPLPALLAWLRPDRQLYRVLLLMPLWGAWSMMISAQFCRPDEGTEAAVSAFARGCGPVISAGSMGVVLVWSIMYLRMSPAGQLGVAGSSVVAAILSGKGLCRLCGGLRRRPLLAANLLTQIVFLLACIAAGA